MHAQYMTAKPKIRDKRNPVATAVGERVKACRIAADLSQEELADAAFLDRTRISAIERGVANPTVETLACICSVLGMTLSELFEPLRISLTPTGERAPTPTEPRRRHLR
ncbi:helix-turn-helix domain-containing protein [Cupriavidus pauculus]|uniref:helix-turn-helix domain-containing protein n=1 Tax=Cupriavidus pauculus TaxID=82633 RepID=UPI001D0C1BB5|nr:helix-turn-helix transcriptional regulator [Cupriavidus pauculus]